MIDGSAAAAAARDQLATTVGAELQVVDGPEAHMNIYGFDCADRRVLGRPCVAAFSGAVRSLSFRKGLAPVLYHGSASDEG